VGVLLLSSIEKVKFNTGLHMISGITNMPADTQSKIFCFFVMFIYYLSPTVTE